MDAAFLSWGLEEQTPEQGSELPTTLKSEEELAKFTVDEFLSDTERTVLFLNGGQIIQQRHAIANLPAVVKARGRQGWESVAGPLKSALNRLDADCQVEAAGMFAHIAKERLMAPADLQACLLPTIVRNINREKSEEETEAWLHALFELVPMLDKEALRTEVLSLALSKGDMEGSAASRVICSSILGTISLFMTKDEVERSFFKRALKMCQDVDHNVRLSSCRQLANIGRTAGRDAVQRNVLDELFELLRDEDLQVRAAAVTCLVQLLDMVSPEVRASRVMPVLRDHMMPFDLDPSMQRSVAKVFGQMVSMIKNEMGIEDHQLFYGCYRHLSSKQDVELRRSCALQIGQLAKAAVAAQPTAYAQHFSETYQTFTTDFDEEVRHAAATQMHDVARCAGKDTCCHLVTRPLLNLLRDDSARVQAAVLQNLTLTLHAFAADTSAARPTALDDIARALLDLDANSGKNWRLQASLAASFPMFHQVFNSDQIHEHFIPMTFRMLSQSAVAARPVAAEGIACFLRYSKKDKQRAELFLHLIREFARGKCYNQRMAFAEVCKHMVKRFSSRFIKDWVFDLCLELLYDAVPNVRLQITHILPALKQTVRLPEDVDLLERLNNAISNSMTDNDRDVSQTARLINDTYKRMPVRMGGSSGTLIDASGGGVAAYEAEDKRREAEEADCTFTPEDAKEIKAEIVQMSYKKKPGEPASKSAINRRVGTDAAKPGASPASRSGASAAITTPAGAKAVGTASPARPASVSATVSAVARSGAPASSTLGGKLAPGSAPTAAARTTPPGKPGAVSSTAGTGIKTASPAKPVTTAVKPVVTATAGNQLKKK